MLNTPCIEWPFLRDKYGYGRLVVNGVEYRAHRVSYEMVHGPIPGGLQGRHKCDNPPCFNADHVEPGTPKQNALDCVQRERTHTYPADPLIPHAELFRQADEYRRWLGVGHAEFSRHIGINEASWSMGRRGYWKPSLQTLERLRAAVSDYEWLSSAVVG
jgi:hypothetical protein